jgi:hypothetical protein
MLVRCGVDDPVSGWRREAIETMPFDRLSTTAADAAAC